MQEFISEDDLITFEGWLKYQGVDTATAAPDELAMWRGLFDEGSERSLVTPKVGLIKIRPGPGEHRYAVAVREGSDLWLTLWVRRSWKGEFFVMTPRGDRDWNPHTSYHLDGTLHMKSFDHKVCAPQNRQPLTGAFRGTEHLGRIMATVRNASGRFAIRPRSLGLSKLPPVCWGRAMAQLWWTS